MLPRLLASARPCDTLAVHAAIESVAAKLPPNNGEYLTEEAWCKGATLENDAYSVSKARPRPGRRRMLAGLCLHLMA